MFSQTAMTRHPYSVITFLELIDNYTGTDIIGSSFAAYYDAIITQRLISSGASVNEVDELKDFLSHAAFQAFSDQSEPVVSLEKLNELYKYFETAYFSSSVSIKKVVHKSILIDKGGKFEFSEEYMWYYLTARYVAHILFKSDYNAYVGFVEDCALNIFKKRYANIAIFIAYFTDDSSVIDSLLSMLDMLFSKAESWRLSDDAREVMLGLSSSDGLMIDASPDYDEKRSALLQQNVTDILADAEHVVAQYTLPFLERGIDDSEFVDEVDSSFDNIDSYMKSVNALLRIHSVIGHILTSRSGTYKAQTLIRCISAMAQASGRYANLNHAIATVLLFDKERYVAEAEHLQMDGDLSAEEKYEKIMRIFAFWSVYMAQAGLARCLSQSHSVRALKHLSETEEAVSAWKGKKIPFNYTSVYILSDLYNTGKINKNEINSVLEKYGRHSSLVAMLRVAFHIYAYYMPMSVQNKQWIAKKLGMSLKTLSKQQFLSFRKNAPSGK